MKILARDSENAKTNWSIGELNQYDWGEGEKRNIEISSWERWMFKESLKDLAEVNTYASRNS